MLQLNKALMDDPRYRHLPDQEKVMRLILDASATMGKVVQEYLKPAVSERGAEEGLPPDVVSLLRAIRCLSAPTQSRDEELATILNLESLVDPREDTPRHIRGQAWALLAHIHWNRMNETHGSVDPGTQLEELYRAAECANKAFANLTTASGEIPPLAELFNIAVYLEQRGLRSSESRTRGALNHAAERFANLGYLWAVVDILKAKGISPYTWFEFMHKCVIAKHLNAYDTHLTPVMRIRGAHLPDDLHDAIYMIWCCIDLQWVPRQQ